MNKQELIAQIKKKKSFLCVGLDPDLEKLPSSIKKNPEGIEHFLKSIIDATENYAVAFKPNLAFFEVLGAEGWELFGKITDYLKSKSLFIIADAKRGDIGNTANKYAETFFKTFNADAVTLSPYMGLDSISPFLKYPGKWAVPLVLTSNSGSSDLQMQTCSDHFLFEKTAHLIKDNCSDENTMIVAGATQGNFLKNLRGILPKHFFLIPGVGAQGGNLKEVSELALNSECGILVNVSRAILYAGSGEDYASASKQKAKEYAQEMESLIKLHVPDFF